MVGQTIAHYRILDELGVGGTGVVYRAQDLRLHREVALKLLRLHVSDEREAAERFMREARITSALHHPHICTVHDVGQFEGRPFIVMERLQGVTLDRLIAGRPLPLDRLVRIAIDVCDALQASHASGIVHRDIKPRNVFVTDHGESKVMDFGLAKIVVGPSTEADSTRLAKAPRMELTEPGLAVGTIAYMAPEQARGERVDGRADLFSLGAVIYEMATGQRAFGGDSAALVFDALLNRAPVPVRTLRPQVPEALAAILERLLEKDRDRRYRSAADVVEDLRDLDVAVTPPRDSRWRWRWPASRRARWAASVAVATSVAVVGALAAWAVRARTAPLAEQDAVLLGAFENRTGEPAFDDTLRYALAVNLGESPYLAVLGDERVAETLRLMGQPPGTPLTSELARAVCQRQRAQAVVEGAIQRTEDTYRLEVTALACADGQVLARERASAQRAEDVLKAVGAVSASLRASLGETLGDLRTSAAPVEQATTSSLAALKEYTTGIALRSRGQELEAIPHFQRAVQLDPEFASAHYALSTIYGSAGDAARSAEYARRAYAAREHVSERERLSISYQYYERVLGDIERAIATLTVWERTFRSDYSPSNGLSLLYSRMGQFERAVEYGREALRRNDDHPFPYSNLAYALRGLNRWPEAKDVALQAVARGFETLPTRRLLYEIAVLEGDVRAAEEHLRAAGTRWRDFDMVGAQAQVAAFEGRRREARALYAKTEELARAGGFGNVADRYALQAGWMELLLGAPRPAAERVTPLLESVEHGVRLGAVTVLALTGTTAGLGAVVDAVARERARDTLLQAVSVPVARAAQSLARGDPRAAVDALEASTPYETGRMAGLVPLWLRGQAYLARGDGASAAAEFRRIMEHRGTEPFGIHYVTASAGLARSLAMAGDVDGARNAYNALFVHWKRADPDLPALVAAREAHARLGKGLAAVTRHDGAVRAR